MNSRVPRPAAYYFSAVQATSLALRVTKSACNFIDEWVNDKRVHADLDVILDLVTLILDNARKACKCFIEEIDVDGLTRNMRDCKERIHALKMNAVYNILRQGIKQNLSSLGDIDVIKKRKVKALRRAWMLNLRVTTNACIRFPSISGMCASKIEEAWDALDVLVDDDDDNMCTVCYEFCVSKTACGHVVCEDCLKKMRAHKMFRCPMCRSDLRG